MAKEESSLESDLKEAELSEKVLLELSSDIIEDEKSILGNAFLLKLNLYLNHYFIQVEEDGSSTDEEDEGIGNGETQSEKEGDTPADLKEGIYQCNMEAFLAKQSDFKFDHSRS